MQRKSTLRAPVHRVELQAALVQPRRQRELRRQPLPFGPLGAHALLLEVELVAQLGVGLLEVDDRARVGLRTRRAGCAQ